MRTGNGYIKQKTNIFLLCFGHVDILHHEENIITTASEWWHFVFDMPINWANFIIHIDNTVAIMPQGHAKFVSAICIEHFFALYKQMHIVTITRLRSESSHMTAGLPQPGIHDLLYYLNSFFYRDQFTLGHSGVNARLI